MSEPLPDDQTPASPEQVAALQAQLRDLYEAIGASRRQHRQWYLGKLRESLEEETDLAERERLLRAIAEVEGQNRA